MIYATLAPTAAVLLSSILNIKFLPFKLFSEIKEISPFVVNWTLSLISVLTLFWERIVLTAPPRATLSPSRAPVRLRSISDLLSDAFISVLDALIVLLSSI